MPPEEPEEPDERDGVRLPPKIPPDERLGLGELGATRSGVRGPVDGTDTPGDGRVPRSYPGVG